MKKIAVFCFIFGITSVVFLSFGSVEPDLIYLQHVVNPNQQAIPVNQTINLISEINKNNQAIKSLVFDDIRIKIENIPFKLKASLYYERDRNFRMFVRSIAGKELDIGSNSTLFWFWSKRMNPPALHYADYKDLYKTNLKTALHPLWLIESLGFSPLSTDASITKSDKYLVLSEQRISTSNTLVVKKTLVDIKRKVIVGHYLYENDQLVASSETTKFYSNNIPSEIAVVWHSENVVMRWELQTVTTNQNINPVYWQMPYFKNKVNLASSSAEFD